MEQLGVEVIVRAGMAFRFNLVPQMKGGLVFLVLPIDHLQADALYRT
jgi:hypothetical protein